MRRILQLVAVVAVTGALAVPGVDQMATATAQDPCGDLVAMIVNRSIACTHGGDAPAPHTARLTLAATDATPPPPCPGNGTRGRRIRVLLGVPAGTATDGPAARSVIRRAIGLADQNLDLQSASIGQHYRFYCELDRRVSIPTVALPAIGSDGQYAFGDVITGLSKAGYTGGRSIYAVFVANIDCCYPFGGQGTLAIDDQPDPTFNANNGAFARYAMIRFGTGYSVTSLAMIFQHETGHNIGAVQDSAPHASGGYHCYEANDVMCYNDGGSYFAGGGTMLETCPDLGVTGLSAFDCGGDDYYNAAPDPGTYLDAHWNTADSRWLTPVGATGD